MTATTTEPSPRSGRRWRRPLTAIWLVPAIGMAACGGGNPKPAADTLATRERQEAIGRSGLPGATGINRAIEVADSATARNRVLDSLGVQP